MLVIITPEELLVIQVSKANINFWTEEMVFFLYEYEYSKKKYLNLSCYNLGGESII